MERDFSIWLDPMSATGVSLAPGAGLVKAERADQLPYHRIEVHAFPSHQRATDFADGIALAGGNLVACSRPAGTRKGRFVAVAYLSEPRRSGESVDETIPVIDHPASSEEGRIISASVKRRNEREAKEREERRAEVSPILTVLAEAGMEATYDDNNRGKVVNYSAWDASEGVTPDGWPAEVFVRPAEDSLWTVGTDIWIGTPELSEKPLDPRLMEVFEQSGMAHSDERDEIAFAPAPLENVPGLVRRATGVWNDITAVCRVIHQERQEREEEEKRRRRRERDRERAKERRRAASGP